MSETKEYDVPDEIIALFIEAEALKELRDAYVRRPFGFKKAKKCSIGMEVANGKAWRMFRELYPASPNKIQYSHETQKIKELTQ